MARLFLAIALGLAVLATGCTRIQLSPGAEQVRVTRNPSEVEEGQLLDTGWTTLGGLTNQMESAYRYARQFTFNAGGDTALIDINMGGENQYGSTMHVMVEAYDTPHHSIEASKEPPKE